MNDLTGVYPVLQRRCLFLIAVSFHRFFAVYRPVIQVSVIGIFPGGCPQKLSEARHLTCAYRALTLASTSTGNAP
ncbi:hypothetical protein [Caballeronia sp.]|uniref:hypothetical protein n=1 Tax=Caballeronia sp. TaxID=1931223 RepID=UPI00263153FA|nr:hypothetical protein [Caballeronia sp.]